MKRRDVRFSPEAGNDLLELYERIAGAAGESVALRYVERIETFCLGFDMASERGHRRDDIRPGLRIIGFEKADHDRVHGRGCAGYDPEALFEGSKLGIDSTVMVAGAPRRIRARCNAPRPSPY